MTARGTPSRISPTSAIAPKLRKTPGSVTSLFSRKCFDTRRHRQGQRHRDHRLTSPRHRSARAPRRRPRSGAAFAARLVWHRHRRRHRAACPQADREAREQGGNPLCTVIYHGERTSPAYAALINGSAGDALDFADSNLAMRGHTTPATVATALAVGEWKDISGVELLGAIVAGVETGCRVGTLVNFPFLKKGFHPTGNLVPFAATAAAAHILGLTPQQWTHALGVAATQAA